MMIVLLPKKMEKKIGAYFTASRRQTKTSDVSLCQIQTKFQTCLDKSELDWTRLNKTEQDWNSGSLDKSGHFEMGPHN